MASVGAPPSNGINQSSVPLARAVDYQEITRTAWDQKLDLERVLHIQSPCKTDNSDMKGIQRTIKNLQSDIERIKRFSNINSAFDALTNENEEPWKSIKKIINLSATDISGYVKNIMSRVRGWTLNSIQNEAKKRLPFLFPGEMPSFIDKLNKGLNGVSCAFGKIVRGLAGTVGDLLFKMLDKFINGPMCLIENFVNNLLNNILGPITAAINSAIGMIGGILSGVQGLADNLFSALDFATGVLNFFKCDDDKACPSVQEISLSGAGQNNPQGGDPPGPNSPSAPSSPSDSKTPQSGQFTSGTGQGEATQTSRIVAENNIEINQKLAESNIPPDTNDLTLW